VSIGVPEINVQGIPCREQAVLDRARKFTVKQQKIHDPAREIRPCRLRYISKADAERNRPPTEYRRTSADFLDGPQQDVILNVQNAGRFVRHVRASPAGEMQASLCACVLRNATNVRILDVKYYILLRSVEEVGTPFDDIQWAAVLRSASAFECIANGTDESPRAGRGFSAA